MIRNIQAMMRDEPITFGVLLLMIAMLLFGAWSSWPTSRKSAAVQTEAVLQA